MATTPVAADFCGLLSESKKIVKAHSRHFLALSVLFLLPISFSLVSFPTLQHSLSEASSPSTPASTRTLLRQISLHPHFVVSLKTLIVSLIFAFVLLTLFLSGSASITYSVYHGFYGRPVKFLSALTSLSTTLPRLFATLLCAVLVLLAIAVVSGAVVFLAIRSIELLGFQISLSEPCFTVLCVIGLVVLVLGFLYVLLNWGLVCAVVVVESSWGFEPLRRSACLARGMRGLALSLLVVFGGIIGLCVRVYWGYSLGSGVVSALVFVLTTVVASACVMASLLHFVAANTVLYMYCKALHGELALEIAREFAREYVCLPFDDEKLPHVVSVIQP